MPLDLHIENANFSESHYSSLLINPSDVRGASLGESPRANVLFFGAHDMRLTTEPVLTEVAYFLRADRVDVDPLFQLLERGAVRLDLQVAEHWPRLRTLMARYDQMDLADASIVVMSERHPRSQVLTVDRADFSIYRRNDRQVIDFIAPPKS